MAKNPLHVGDRHLRIAGHPVGRRVTKIVKGPVRPQAAVGAHEHRPGRVIGQRPERFPQRPPQRIIRPGGHQPVCLGLIQPQPDKRIRRRGQLLHRPGTLADHRDQLLPDRSRRRRLRAVPTRAPRWTPTTTPAPGPGASPVRRTARRIFRSGIAGERAGRPWAGNGRCAQHATAASDCGEPAACHSGPGPAGTDSPSVPSGLQMELIKTAQHRLAMRDRGRSVLIAGDRLARDAIDAARAAAGLGCQY